MPSSRRRDRAGRRLIPSWLILGFLLSVAATAGAPPADPVTADARAIEASLDAILGRHVRGGLVDYAALKVDEALDRHVAMLRATDPETLASHADRLAFWINAYNALVLKGVVDLYPVRSVADTGAGENWRFFRGTEFTVGRRTFTLDAIEHDILRAGFREPRVHFALVCASLGCPELRPEAFHGDRIEAELTQAARRFVNDARRVSYDRAAGILRLSRIFDWYREDFLAASPSLAAWVGRYLEAGPPPEGTTIEWLDYSWNLNDTASAPRGIPSGPTRP